MNRRNVLTTLGATALGASVLFGGTIKTLAQEADTVPEVAQANTQNGRAEFEAERAQAYNDFVAALAGELDDDEAAVDTAIRTALTQAVDARLSAGEIDEEQAAAAKAVIQVSDAPLMAGFGGPGGPAGFQGRGGGRGQGGPGFIAEHGEKGLPRLGDDQSTSALPAASNGTDAEDESANAPVDTGENVTS